MTRTCGYALMLCAFILGSQIASACTLPEGFEAIRSREELSAIRSCYPSTSCQGAPNTTHYMVMNDIDMGPANFSPIGVEFRGKLLGCKDNPPVIRNLRIVSAGASYGALFQQISGDAEIANLVFEDFHVSVFGNAAVITTQLLGAAKVHDISFRRSTAASTARVVSTGTQSVGGNAALVAAYVDQTLGDNCVPTIGQGNAECVSIRDIHIEFPADSPTAVPEVEAQKGNAGGIVARMAQGVISGVFGSISAKGHQNAGGVVASAFPSATSAVLVERVDLTATIDTIEWALEPCYYSVGLPCGNAGGVVSEAIGPTLISQSGIKGQVRGHLFVGGIAGVLEDSDSTLENVYVTAAVHQLTPTQYEPQEIGGAGGVVGHLNGELSFSYSSVNGISAMLNRAGALVFESSLGVSVNEVFFGTSALPPSMTGLTLGTGHPASVLQLGPQSPQFLFNNWDFDLWQFEEGEYPRLQYTQSCYADFDGDGQLAVGDIFSYLSSWFSQDPRADINSDGLLQVDDIFGFLAAWFAAMALPSSCG